MDDPTGFWKRLEPHVPAMAREVAADVGAEAAELEPLVRRFIAAISRGRRLPQVELARLRDEGAEAARAGETLQGRLDRYLSTGWVVWGHVVQVAADGEGERLAEVGSALLRAGDDAAAALAAGYTAAERSLAARAGAMRRAVLDDLLAPGPRPRSDQARLGRRAVLVGLDPDAPHRLIFARAAAELEEEGPVAEAVSRVLARARARQGRLVAVRDGDLVMVLAEPWRDRAVLAQALEQLAAAGAWWAVRSAPVRLADASAAASEALDALSVVRRAGRTGELVEVGELALERALLADPGLLATAVERWMGPLLAARGGDDLVTTLEAWFAVGEAVVPAARMLGVSPRTVSYRLERVASLLGRPLDAPTRARLATALLGRSLLLGRPTSATDPDG